MTLYIDTTKNDSLEVYFKKGEKIIAKKRVVARRNQAEKLLSSIDKLCKENHLKLSSVKEIRVANRGGSFTSLRIGVVTANALGYALGVPVKGLEGGAKNISGLNIVEPIYDKGPNITYRAYPRMPYSP